MDELKGVVKAQNRSVLAMLDPAGIGLNRAKVAPRAQAQPAADVISMPDEEATKAAQRRKLAAMKRRGGRESTILAGDDRLGG